MNDEFMSQGFTKEESVKEGGGIGGGGRGIEVLEPGQKIRIWSNHACITSSGFGWYLVVDGGDGDGDRVVDIWVRFRGW